MNLLSLLVFFAVLIAFSASLNFLLLKWTKTLGRKNEARTSEIRWSCDYKPAVGGISFYFAFIITLLAYFAIFSDTLNAEQEYIQYGIALAVTLGFFAGLADDAYNTVPWLKFTSQFSCGLILVLFGLQIEFFEVAWLDGLLTIFWTISVMNSINMLDNMDGITASVAISILLSAATCALPLSEANMFYTIVCGGTVAALLGFLFLNWNPSKMFMGDTGSQMIGALLAAVGIAFFWNHNIIFTDNSWYPKIALVLCAFVVPIGDSLTVTINRLLRGQSPFVGGRDHTTHHLSYAGLSDRSVAYTIITISGISVGLIGGIHFIPAGFESTYLTLLLIYAIISMAFLYSSTVWKKSRSQYKSLNASEK